MLLRLAFVLGYKTRQPSTATSQRCARSIVIGKREPMLRASVCERCCLPCHCRHKTFHLNRLRRRTRRRPPRYRRRRYPLRRFLQAGRQCRQMHRQSPLSPRGVWPPSAARGCHPALNSPTDHVTQATPPGFPSRAPRHKTQLEADLRRTAGSTVRRDAGATQAYEDAADDRHAADTRLTLRTTGHGATGMGSDGAPAARQRPNRSRSRAARLWGAAPVV